MLQKTQVIHDEMTNDLWTFRAVDTLMAIHITKKTHQHQNLEIYIVTYICINTCMYKYTLYCKKYAL